MPTPSLTLIVSQTVDRNSDARTLDRYHAMMEPMSVRKTAATILGYLRNALTTYQPREQDNYDSISNRSSRIL